MRRVFVFFHYVLLFCITSSSILCTVPKVAHMTAKTIQSIKSGRKKTVRCKKKLKRERWQVNGM